MQFIAKVAAILTKGTALMNEIWMPIPSFENLYSASTLGRVRSEARIVIRRNGHRLTVAERILQQVPNADGYLTVNLHRDFKQNTRYVHDLITSTFLGPKPAGLEVRHLDDDKANCALGNLVYGSRSQNQMDAVRNGVHYFASRTECSAGHVYAEGTFTRRQDRPRTRICRICERDRGRRFRENRSAA